jgi:peptidyl-prolyl cis-trans isomerase C
MPFNKTYLALALALITLPAGAAEPSSTPSPTPDKGPAMVRVDPATPIARVNGVVLNALQLNMLRDERSVRAQGGEPGGDETLRDALINAEIMAQEATRLGLDKPLGIQTALELNRKELLGRALLDDYMAKHPVADERVKAEYDKLKSKAGDTEYHARHILVDDEKQAKDILAKLKSKKAKFEDLAKKNSKDSSATSGGDLPWMAPNQLVPEFAQALTAMKKGDVSQAPVKSRFGWHIIKLEETRPIAFPEYDKVKGRITGQLAQMDVRKYVAELRAGAKVEVPSSTPPAAPGKDPAPASK